MPPKPPEKLPFDLAILPKLSKDVLGQIVSRGRALLAFGGPVEIPVESGDKHEWLLTGVLRELQSRGLNGSIPPSIVKDMKEYKKQFEPVAPGMDAWLRGLIHDDAERVELLALSRLAAQCLAERISTRFHAPVCLSTMLRFYIQVPDAIEDAFPSYCQNGWVPMLLKRKAK